MIAKSDKFFRAKRFCLNNGIMESFLRNPTSKIRRTNQTASLIPFVCLSSWIHHNWIKLDSIRVEFLGEIESFLKGFLRFARQSSHKATVYQNSCLSGICHERFHFVQTGFFLHIIQDLLKEKR